MSAEAGTASRRGHDRAALDERLDVARFERLQIDLVGRRNDDRAHIGGDVFAFEHFRRLFEVAQSAVGAAADHDLIDLDLLFDLVDKRGVGRQMRLRDDGTDRRKIDVDHALVCVVVRGGKAVERLAAALESVLVRLFVDGEDAVLCAALDRHVADGEAVVHAQAVHALAAELYRLVERAVYADHADDVPLP